MTTIHEDGRPVSDLQERIAKAIYDGTPRSRPWHILPLYKKQSYRSEALSVMKEIYYPSLRMVQVGQESSPRPITTWQAMISAEISIAEGGSNGN